MEMGQNLPRNIPKPDTKPTVDGLYRPFMVIWGMVYHWACHRLMSIHNYQLC
jgi:hypothetical protein